MSIQEVIYTMAVIASVVAGCAVMVRLEKGAIRARHRDYRDRFDRVGIRTLGNNCPQIVLSLHENSPHNYKLAVGNRVFGFRYYQDLVAFISQHGFRMTDPVTGLEYLHAYTPQPRELVTDLSHPSVR